MRRPPAARPVTAILLVGLAVEMLAGCAGNAFSEPARVSRRGGTVKIGFVAPLSGPFASLGHDMRRGFHLYLDRHEGRLGGRRVDLVDADEGAGPETGVPAVQRLVTRDRVAAVVGIVNSAVALGSRRTFVEARVPLIVATAGANALTGMQGSEFIWRTSFASADFNDAAGRWLARQPPVPGGVFLLAADFVAGREQIAGFKTAFTAGGGHIAGELYSPFGTTQDFQPYLAQVRASGAGAVYAFYAGEDAVNFVRQYRDFGLAGRIPLYGPGSLTEGPVLDAQGAAADGIITANNYSWPATRRPSTPRPPPTPCRPTTPPPCSTPSSATSARTATSPVLPWSPSWRGWATSRAPGGRGASTAGGTRSRPSTSARFAARAAAT